MEVFWFDLHEPPVGLGLGIGVTAFDRVDAESMIESKFGVLRIARLREIKSLDQLEANHVRPNIGNHLKRGIWFPNYSDGPNDR